MAKPRLLYNLYEGEEIVMQEVTAEEIREKTGMPKLKLRNYERTGAKIKSIYRVEQCGIVASDAGNKRHITSELWEEWKKVCSRLNGISGLDRIVLVPER